MKKPHTVIWFANGVAAVCDTHGNQIPQLQGTHRQTLNALEALGIDWRTLPEKHGCPHHDEFARDPRFSVGRRFAFKLGHYWYTWQIESAPLANGNGARYIEARPVHRFGGPPNYNALPGCRRFELEDVPRLAPTRRQLEERKHARRRRKLATKLAFKHQQPQP